jgi:UDP-N-acetylmuramate dehydrogenase
MTHRADAFAAIRGLLVLRDEPLAEHTTFRVGGPADLFLVPEHEDALREALIAARDSELPVFILGGGTNVLAADAGFRGAIVLIERNLSRMSIEGERIRVGAGVRLPALGAAALKAGLSGIESLAGIPGAVGGALAINAGAFGAEFIPLVENVDGFTLDGAARRVPRSAIRCGYRTAVYPEPIVFTGATLRLQPDDPRVIGKRSADIRSRRAATQPTRDKSAGCAFRNPPGHSAGRLIDSAGLKGLRVGGATVSTVHANYLVNTGAATADDIRRLIDEVKARVLAASGVRLEEEVRMLGFAS